MYKEKTIHCFKNGILYLEEKKESFIKSKDVNKNLILDLKNKDYKIESKIGFNYIQ